MLENHPEPAPFRGKGRHVSTFEFNGAMVREFESTKEAEEGGFAATARPQEGEDLSLSYGEGNPIHGSNRTEILAETL